MDSVLNFLANNYIWFLIASVVLVLGLIGFLVDDKRKEKVKALADENADEPMPQAPQQPVDPNATITGAATGVAPVATVTPTDPAAVQPVVQPTIGPEPTLNNFEAQPTDNVLNLDETASAQSIFDVPGAADTTTEPGTLVLEDTTATSTEPVAAEPQTLILDPGPTAPVAAEPVTETPAVVAAPAATPVIETPVAATPAAPVMPEVPATPVAPVTPVAPEVPSVPQTPGTPTQTV